MKQKILPIFIAAGGLTSASALAQHVHGVVQLGVVVEGDTVAVSLTAPLSDVVGFEHEPSGDEQVEKIRQAAALLENADAMFGLPESAKCDVSDVSIEGPPFFRNHLAEKAATETADDHDHDHHDSHHSHDSHDSETAHEEHSEINANYEWVCGDESMLDNLELRFTEGFTSVEIIEIQILTTAGAKVLKREGRVESIPLSAP